VVESPSLIYSRRRWLATASRRASDCAPSRQCTCCPPLPSSSSLDIALAISMMPNGWLETLDYIQCPIQRSCYGKSLVATFVAMIISPHWLRPAKSRVNTTQLLPVSLLESLCGRRHKNPAELWRAWITPTLCRRETTVPLDVSGTVKTH